MELAGRYATLLLQATSLMALGCAFLGFGASLALLHFGVDILELVANPVDLVRLSAYPIIQTLNGITSNLNEPDITDFRLQAFGYLTAAISITIAPAYLWITSLPSASPALREHSSRVRHFLRSACRSFWSWLRREKVLRFWRMPLIAGTSWLMGWLIPWLFLLAARWAMLAIFVAMLIPICIGYWQSEEFFYQTVVEPTACATLENAEARRKHHADRSKQGNETAATNQSYSAVCVMVQAKDMPERRGRKVIATTDAIVLYDPATGALDIVPRKDAVVSLVDKLSP